MDEVKLKRWIKDFNNEAEKMQIASDIVFQDSDISDSYELEIDSTSQNLNLVITNKELPSEIVKRLRKLLIKTKPEDSV